MAKQLNPLQIKQELKKDFPKILIIAGEDPSLGNFAIDLAKSNLSKKLKIKDANALRDHVFVFIGTETSIADFHSEFFNIPLFGGERLFIIEEAENFFKNIVKDKKKDNSKETNSSYYEEFGKAIKNFPEATTLLIIDSRPKTPAAITKLFPGVSYFENRPLWDNEKEALIEENSREFRIQIEKDAHAYLLEITAGKTMQIRLAFLQLQRYLRTSEKNTAFSISDLESILDIEATGSIFTFIDALFLGDTEKSLRLLTHLDLKHPPSFLPLIYNILVELNRIRKYHTAKKSKVNQDDFFAYLGIFSKSSYYRNKKITEYQNKALLFPPKKIQKLSSLIYKLQKEMKSSLSDFNKQTEVMKDLILEFHN